MGIIMQSHLTRITGEVSRSRSRHLSLYLSIVAVVLFFFFCLVILFFTAPLEKTYYPKVFSVPEGSTLRVVARDLQEQGVINSPSLFILSNYLIGNRIVWGSYSFSGPRGVVALAFDLYTGNKDVSPVKIVVPEESDVYDIANIFERQVEDFDRIAFLDVGLREHGYLYPDTYFFAEDYITAEHVVETMTANFSRRTDDLFSSYQGDFSRDEIVTLASIVELEASRYEDRRKIAGVLFNRLELGMPLQVDVSFLFIEGKNTFQLSREDLNSDDPSNTYKYRGIPPIPITNPTRKSIGAVVDPIESDHLYFLADFYGNTYYSKTYNEHLVKRDRYIKNKETPLGFSHPVNFDLDETSDSSPGSDDSADVADVTSAHSEGGPEDAGDEQNEGSVTDEEGSDSSSGSPVSTDEGVDLTDGQSGPEQQDSLIIIPSDSGAVLMR